MRGTSPALVAIGVLLLAALATVAAAEVGGAQVVTAAGAWEKYPSLVVAADGTAWLASTLSDGAADTVVIRSRNGAGWGEPLRLDAGAGVEGGAELVAAGDTVWAFWHGRRDGRWAVYGRSWRKGAWQSEQRLSPADGDRLNPAAAVDRDGTLWLAWEVAVSGGFALELSRRERSGWTPPTRVPTTGSDRRPVLAADPAGGVLLAWDSTRSGNFDIWLARATAGRKGAVELGAAEQVTSHPAVDDSPALAVTGKGDVWLAFTSMRTGAGTALRVDRYRGAVLTRVRRGGRWLAPPGDGPQAVAGEVSVGYLDKTPGEVGGREHHWIQSHNLPTLLVDGADRVWVVWRSDLREGHNYDLFARVHDGGRWSAILDLTPSSAGRDEWPDLAAGADGELLIAWESQRAAGGAGQPGSGRVDLQASPNVVAVGALPQPNGEWRAAVPVPVGDELLPAGVTEDRLAAPAPAEIGKDPLRRYFGDPHSHSVLSDGASGLPDQLVILARDRLGLDFAAVTDHAEMGRLLPSEWAELQLVAATFTEPGRFVALAGWEWTGGLDSGHRTVLFGDDGAPPLSSASRDGDTVKELNAYVRAHGGIASPHHTGNARWGRWNPAAEHDEAVEPNFEIASWHGRYEFYGNPWPGRPQVPGHQFQDALRRGRHVGVMAGSDTHYLAPGDGGVTAVLAPSLDRAALVAALRERSCYATTGPRIELALTVAGAGMGSVIQHRGDLPIAVLVRGTAPLERVEIVRDGEDAFAAVRVEQAPGAVEARFVVYDHGDAQTVRVLKVADAATLDVTFFDIVPRAAETSYYLRITQVDGHQAWSSPVWVRP